MNPWVAALLGALGSLITTGSATVTLPPQTVPVPDLGTYSIDETITIKKIS